jgi:hypothetical protein
MNYFQAVCFIFGGLILLTRPIMHLFPKKWNDFELNTAYTEKQPAWVWVVAGIGILLVGFTWYQHITTDVPNSLVITLILSLTLVKISQVLFNYEMFRKFAVRVLTKDRKILTAINFVVIFLGVAVISMGFLLY